MQRHRSSFNLKYIESNYNSLGVFVSNGKIYINLKKRSFLRVLLFFKFLNLMENSSIFIPTRAALGKTNAEKEFKVTTHHTYKKTKTNQDNKHISPIMTEIHSGDINMKRARHEIIKFGMSGFNTEKKEEAKIQLAIRLGAKPPKNKCKNYKQLLEDKKTEKKVVQSLSDFQQLGKTKMGKSNAKGKGYDRKRRKLKGGLLDAYGTAKLPANSISKTSR